MSQAPRILVLGSTGSIGRSTLEVVAHLRSTGLRDLPVVGLAAGTNIELLAEQASQSGATDVAIADPQAATAYRGPGRVHAGACELVTAIAEPGDIIVAAIVGAAGIDAVLAGIERGCRIALANKETLVAAGSVVIPAAAAAGVEILPVDSEHSAIFQCLHGEEMRGEVERLVLTASGGPFRGREAGEIASATIEQALNHPTWDMGAKISIDSATLANKALEIIEAHWLFSLPAEQIDAIVHPQSIVHGFVEFADGSVLAQCGPPDMRTPIQYALTWPDRVDGSGRRMNWSELSQLDFEPIDHDAFPLIRLAWQAIRSGGTAGAVLNAANEVAVEAFLGGGIRFGDISTLVSEACAACPPRQASSLADIRAADAEARRFVQSHLPNQPATA
ncbi:MAG: 1-deoxy-D-xylulose-5-phosphate reductoisomerase [Phycisphaerales bacterium]|nr:1-deoxy-D-xylulose-5-phosphate reductoisomerase [Phycisphaerales bacterium]MDP7189076.1 1-deoxy-D-xylulose-5-phosphate reductoisomerase [Phycisphaerales bacterium]MDP7519793.1 1-deoxy-D-xylulose-5-phosphate reductoisomerase [Phycisphaerales bacterium]HJN79647.1 1-deoxy-D-xylulose-5-phosphate reductoisomerase [Phycisphaerales bacterium]